MNKRDDFSQKTIDRLCERVGGKCSNPNCRRETKGPHSNPQKRVSIGEAAHITAAAEGGQQRGSNGFQQRQQCVSAEGAGECDGDHQHQLCDPGQ